MNGTDFTSVRYVEGMSHKSIPMDWVEGAEETTLWLWPDQPDPTTVRFDRGEWEEIEESADGDIEAFVSRVITADLEEHREVLSG